MKLPGWTRNTGETFKLELWARYEPAHGRDLALWAGSTGVLTQRETIKTEPLDLRTKNVSVRAFIEGKPVWLARERVNDPALRPYKKDWIKAVEGRWDRYLAVPIRLDAAGDSNIAVGVVTLAARGSAARRPGSSATNVPIGNALAMTKLIDAMTTLGVNLLRP